MSNNNFKRSVQQIEGKMYTLTSYDDKVLPRRRLALYHTNGRRVRPAEEEKRLVSTIVENPLMAEPDNEN